MAPSSASDWPVGAALPPPPPFPPPPSRRSRQPVFRMPAFDHVEDVNMYKPGGHHPVVLGDVLAQRFKIMHKLGDGGFALVWLARDLEQNRYVALKVLRADASDREILALEHIQKVATGSTHVVKLHETFNISGPNGVHQCLVMDVGGPSLQHVTVYWKQPGLRFLKNASQNLAEALAAVHSTGVCHGDLTHSNVLFEIKGLQDWTESQIYHYFGAPQVESLFLLNGLPAPPFAPAHVVRAINFPNLTVDQLSGKIMIVDFGEAFFESNVPEDLGTPASFYAPELLFGYAPSYSADLWALGCLIFEMHTFWTLVPTAFGTMVEALGMAIDTIGALPEAWMGRYEDEDNSLHKEMGEVPHWFDSSIQRGRLLGPQIPSLMPGLSQDQINAFVELLQSIVVFEPDRRLSAEAVWKHRWFRED